MSLTLISTYTCDKCGAQRQWYRQSPSMPGGWVMLGEAVYCDKHNLKLTVDGETVEHKQQAVNVERPAWETDP